MKTNLIIIVLFLLCANVVCDKNTTKNDKIISIEDLLVKNNEITGWTFSGAGWIANNVSELTVYINGAAEIYQRHGFIEAAHQTYQGTIDNADRLLKITVYNQTDATNALATYQDPDLGHSGAIEWIDGAGTAAHYLRYGGLSQVLTFYRNAYFVLLELNYDTEESLNILKQFALNVDGKIQ